MKNFDEYIIFLKETEEKEEKEKTESILDHEKINWSDINKKIELSQYRILNKNLKASKDLYQKHRKIFL